MGGTSAPNFQQLVHLPLLNLPARSFDEVAQIADDLTELLRLRTLAPTTSSVSGRRDMPMSRNGHQHHCL